MNVVTKWDVVDGEILGAYIVCPTCEGAGLVESGTCSVCDGDGRVHRPYQMPDGTHIDLHRPSLTPEQTRSRRRAALTEGLVGDYAREYTTSASFHHAIDMLVRLLPAWVDGLAVEAEKDRTRLAERISQAEQADLPKREFAPPEGWL